MKNSKCALAGIFLLIFSIMIGGCGGQSSTASTEQQKQEIRFQDVLGREIVLAKPAQRVLIGFYAESFMAVGGPDALERVAAMSKGEWRDFFYPQFVAYTQQLPQLEKIVDTGSIYGGSFSIENAIATRPDVAILAPFQYDTLGDNVKKLEAAGIRVVVIDYNSLTLEKHVTSTLVLGKVLGQEERAKQLADEYKAAVEDVKNRVAGANDKPKRVYFELGNKEATDYGNSYGDYMWGSMIGLAGGENIALGKVKSYGALSPEYILSANPEVIFFAGLQFSNQDKKSVLTGFNIPAEVTQQSLVPYEKRPGWDKLQAFRDREVYVVDHGSLRSVYDYVFLQYIAKALHPKAFQDVDPSKNHAEFYRKYLPVKPVGTFMLKMEG